VHYDAMLHRNAALTFPPLPFNFATVDG